MIHNQNFARKHHCCSREPRSFDNRSFDRSKDSCHLWYEPYQFTAFFLLCLLAPRMQSQTKNLACVFWRCVSSIKFRLFNRFFTGLKILERSDFIGSRHAWSASTEAVRLNKVLDIWFAWGGTRGGLEFYGARQIQEHQHHNFASEGRASTTIRVVVFRC